MGQTVLRGGCHCGNLSLSFTTERTPSELPVRACQCTFCRPRRARWTSDPNGQVVVEVTDESDLGRYRFGTETADFLFCRRCSSLVVVVNHEESPRAVIHVDALEMAAEFREPLATDFDGESLEARLARRAQGWTPVSLRFTRPGEASP